MRILLILSLLKKKASENKTIGEINYCTDYVIDYCDSHKYLGVWMDEHLTFNKNAKELAKSASRALGSLMSKVVTTGGMTHRVYTKLYISTVEPILMYGSGIWGTKQLYFVCSK